MKIFSDKRRFYKSFVAVSAAMLMAFSSLVSVAAAMVAPAAEIAVESGSEEPEKNISVVLDVNGKQTKLMVSQGTVADAIDEAGVKPGKNQIVFPTLNTQVKNSMIVKICTAKPVEVTADGKTGLMVLAYGNVVDSLKLAGVKLGSEDILSVKRDEKVENIKKLTIQRVTYNEVSQKSSIDFEKVTENSDEVELGETKIGTKGEKGEKLIIKKVKYIDGKAVKETVVSETVTKKPVNEVTLIGTKGVATTGGAGTFTDSNGVTVAYKEMFTGSGTAYTAPAGASTATGAPAHHGGVAIDPTMIPYGSRLYVESVDGSIVYGYCTAIDTGGFCDDGSGIIDVFYDTYDECVNWGRRDVNVYVIE